MTKLRSLVEETGIGLLLVSHLRRRGGDKGFEEGKEVTLSHLRGSASIGHLSDAVVPGSRPQAPPANVTETYNNEHRRTDCKMAYLDPRICCQPHGITGAKP